MQETWYLLDSGAGAPEWNMAADAVLLEWAANIGAPVLRWYGWTCPAATHGYFQKTDDVAEWTTVRPLVRRPTGGGLVIHEREWTYAVVFPPSHPWHKLRAVESYRRLHGWLRDAFALLGAHVELAPKRDPAGPGRCFVGAEPNDLVCDGRKIAGAAQRRTRDGFLIQGSILEPEAGIGRNEFLDALCQVAARQWDVSWTSFPSSKREEWEKASDSRVQK